MRRSRPEGRTRADGLWRIEHVLADLRSDRLASVRRLGKPEPAYRKLTFHKDHLETTSTWTPSFSAPATRSMPPWMRG